MTVRHMRLALGSFFVAAGTGLLAVRFLAPELVARTFDLMRLTLGALLALVLGSMNLAKWYAGRVAYEQRATPVRRPLQSDPAQTGREQNPEFDFDRTGSASPQGPAPH